MSDSMNPKDRAAQARDKAPLHYLEPAAEEGIARAMKSGADKYGYRNYTIEPIKATVYIDAILRHAQAWRNGQDVDPDSGLHPLDHIGANVHVAKAAMESGMFIDDRGGEVRHPEPQWRELPAIPEAAWDVGEEKSNDC